MPYPPGPTGPELAGMNNVKRIFLLRHAKSGHGDRSQDDHDRPLAPRGRKACPLIADHFRARYAAPDLVLCSTARRTRETLALITERLGAAWPTAFEPGLYLAAPSSLLVRLRRLDDSVASVLLIGHNPGIELLAASLSRDRGAAPEDRKSVV